MPHIGGLCLCHDYLLCIFATFGAMFGLILYLYMPGSDHHQSFASSRGQKQQHKIKGLKERFLKVWGFTISAVVMRIPKEV